MKKYFGTDGIRGVANVELTPELVFRLGRATVGVLAKKAQAPKILVGKDPRLSSDMLEGALAAGILSAGGHAYAAGVIPTPGVSFLTRTEGFEAGVMISASHNPIEDNGIKIFGGSGHKLSDAEEQEIESHLRSRKDLLPRPTGPHVGRLFAYPDGLSKYLVFLKSSLPHSLVGFKLVLDCAYGATSVTAPRLFQSLGASVAAHHAEPDGSRINVNCGATDLAFLRQVILQEGADVGMAFDGDGDRVILVNKSGDIINGDAILAILARQWRNQEKLRGPVVTTLMANYGLEEALGAERIKMVRTPVGDRYVLEEMLRQNANLGGEQSGHILLLDYSVAGDGCLTALQIFKTFVEEGQSISALTSPVKEFPQLLVNVPVQNKKGLKNDEEIRKTIHEEESRLRGRGRIVVRPSGTEPLVRVMAEGPDAEELVQVVNRVAKTIEMRLG